MAIIFGCLFYLFVLTLLIYERYEEIIFEEQEEIDLKKRFDSDEIVKYEVDRIKNGEVSPRLFFQRGVAMQNSHKTYDETYADTKFEITCNVLCTVGFCEKDKCHHCKLNAAHDRAVMEIRNGRRVNKNAESTRIVYENGIAYKSVRTVDAAGIITQVMYPIKEL